MGNDETRIIKNINFKRYPYRGIITEIASEEGITTPTVIAAIRNENPRILQMIMDKADAREKIVERFRNNYAYPEITAN